MTNIEKTIADIILKKYDEEESDFCYTDYRIYADSDHFNGIIRSQGEATDVLFFQYTLTKDTGKSYVQIFVSSPDDMCQDFVYLTSLPEDEQKLIFDRFMLNLA